MKKLFIAILFLSFSCFSFGQCSSTNVSVSSSDTTFVQLYHPGFFNIPSGFANICEWEVTTYTGELLFEATTSGTAFEQGQVLFDHSVPITDSMNVYLKITNDTIGITCTINDTLFWEETEVVPGSFIGNWAILNESGGTEAPILSSIVDLESKIKIYPTIVTQQFTIESKEQLNLISLFNANGQSIESFPILGNRQLVDISNFATGVYYVQLLDKYNKQIGIRKIVKM